MPHMTKDPVSVAAAVVQNLNTFVARNASVTAAEQAVVISVTSITVRHSCFSTDDDVH